MDIEKHIMVTKFEDTDAMAVCNMDSEIDDEAYISFVDKYDFLNLPETWNYQEGKLSKRITAETVLDFYQQVIDAMRKLTDWINELPDINTQP